MIELRIALIVLLCVGLPFVLPLYFLLSREVRRRVLCGDDFKPRFEPPNTAVAPVVGSEVKRVEATELVMRNGVNAFAKKRPVIITEAQNGNKRQSRLLHREQND